jgi:ketosteroid isomerase-like protein
MSQENVEIVRRSNTAYNRGDDGAFLKLLAPDAELRDLANAPDQSGIVKGRDAIREVWALWTAAFDEFSADIEEYMDEGNVVICDVHWRGQGKGSGMLVDQRQFDVYELREGQIVRATLGYRSKAEALEDARRGLHGADPGPVARGATGRLERRGRRRRQATSADQAVPTSARGEVARSGRL